MAIEIFTNFTVISDVGETANSYISVEDTKSLWELDPFKQGTALTDEEIGRAVITATTQLNNKYGNKYLGYIYDETYALFFPRTNLADSRGIAIDEYTTFPSEVANSAGIQAWYASSSNRSEESSVSGVKQNKMDGLGSQTFFSPAQQKNSGYNLISSEVELMIAPYVLGGANPYVSFMGRG